MLEQTLCMEFSSSYSRLSVGSVLRAFGTSVLRLEIVSTET